jgi:hypothetical protein
MKKYVAIHKGNDKMILEDWVNKYYDLPDSIDEALEVAKYMGFKNNEIVIKSVSEIEYKYFKGNE